MATVLAVCCLESHASSTQRLCAVQGKKKVKKRFKKGKKVRRLIPYFPAPSMYFGVGSRRADYVLSIHHSLPRICPQGSALGAGVILGSRGVTSRK